MTKKRFTVTQDFEEHHRQIRDNGHIIMGCFVEPQAEVIVDLLNAFHEENEQLKQQLFETSKELLWATSDEVDRALHYEDEVEELRKEIFE